MTAFERLSLSRKLMVITIGTSALSLLLAMAGLGAYEWFAFRTENGEGDFALMTKKNPLSGRGF